MTRLQCVNLLSGREPIARCRLTDQQKELFERLIRENCRTITDPQGQALSLANVANSIVQEVMNDDQRKINRNFANPAKHTAVIWENLPIGKFNETPKDGLRPRDKDIVSEAVMFGFAATQGFPFGYLNEKKGEIVQQIVPIDDFKVSNSNSSRSSFGFHVDNIFLKLRFRQEIIMLLGLRNPSRAATLLLDFEELIRNMTDKMWDWAWQANCRFPASASFDLGGALVYSEPRPLIAAGADGFPRLSANSYNMRGLTTEDEEMIREFVTLTNSVKHHRIVLSAGDLCMFHDDFAMHGREPFDGDRWLQRMYVRSNLDDLWSIAGNRAARVFDVRQFFFN